MSESVIIDPVGVTVKQTLAAIGGTLVVIIAPVLSGVAIVLGGAHLGFERTMIVVFMIFVIALNAFFAGLILASWLVDRRTDEGRTPFRVLVSTVALLQVFALAVVIWTTVAAKSSTAIPILIALAGVLFTAAAIATGDRLWAARSRVIAIESPWIEIAEGAGRRAKRTVLIALGVAITIALLLIAVTSLTTGVAVHGSAAAFALEERLGANFLAVALLAAGLVSAVVAGPYRKAARAQLRGTYARQLLFRDVVSRGRSRTLDEEQGTAAARYAQAMALNLPLSCVTIATIIIATALEQASSSQTLWSMGAGLFQAIASVCMITIGGTAVAVQAGRAARARRYADEHRKILAHD